MSNLAATAKDVVKRRTPSWMRSWFRNAQRFVNYVSLRTEGQLFFPILGPVAPLRGFESNTKEYARRAHVRYIQLEGEQLISLKSDQANDFVTPATFVAVIPHGRVVFDYGVVLTPQHTLLAEISPELGGHPERHPALLARRLPALVKVSGSVAVLSSTAHQRYYHWMFDVLPRLDLLRRSGVGVDRLMLNNELQYQKDSISLLGIEPSMIVSPGDNTHIEAQQLVVPSLPGRLNYPTPASCRFLRESFLDLSVPNDSRVRIYITRSDALTRRVVNEDQLYGRLKHYDFIMLALEGLSLSAQISIFSDAEFIIGPHGAAFTNILFSNPGTSVIELCPERYSTDSFKIISAILGLNYMAMSASTSDDQTHDMVVDVERVERTVAKRIRQAQGESSASLAPSTRA